MTHVAIRLFCLLSEPFIQNLLAQAALDTGGVEQKAKKGLFVLMLLILVPVVIAIGAGGYFIYKATIGKKMQTTLKEDYQIEASRFEQAGRFVSAAHVYETKLKNRKKAAELYERGGDIRRAATLYDYLGVTAKAKELYIKQGAFKDAAEIAMAEGEFEEAARYYEQGGMKMDAAKVLERAGRHMAAVRFYREGGDYQSAARMLEKEGMYREAAEMFLFSLGNKPVDKSSIEAYYIYAHMLEKAGETKKALSLYRKMDAVDRSYKDVRERLQTLSPSVDSSSEEEVKIPPGTTTLRNFIRTGGMEPKHGLKLWVQIMRKLTSSHAEGRPYGLLSPENILIDTKNNIMFLSKLPASAYTAPEVPRGQEPDLRSDIYSMGVILYEMLTGNVDGLGMERVIDVNPGVPEWLDEIVIRCIRKVRQDRFQSVDDIVAELKALSQGRS